MKPKETINGIKIINTLNSEIKRKSNNKYEQGTSKNIFKRDKARIKRTSNHVSKSSSKNDMILSKKQFMTKEQRKILKTFLKENAKKNRKAVAKNLIGFFMESGKNKDKFQFNSKIKIENNKKLQSTKEMPSTPRINFRPRENKSDNIKKVPKKNQKIISAVDIKPSGFNKEQKSKFNSNAKDMSNKKLRYKSSDKDVQIKMINKKRRKKIIIT